MTRRHSRQRLDRRRIRVYPEPPPIIHVRRTFTFADQHLNFFRRVNPFLNAASFRYMQPINLFPPEPVVPVEPIAQTPIEEQFPAHLLPLAERMNAISERRRQERRTLQLRQEQIQAEENLQRLLDNHFATRQDVQAEDGYYMNLHSDHDSSFSPSSDNSANQPPSNADDDYYSVNSINDSEYEFASSVTSTVNYDGQDDTPFLDHMFEPE